MFEVKTLVAISFYAGSQTGEPGNEKWASSQGRPFSMPSFTLIKKKIKFASYTRNSEGSCCKVIYEEGFLLYEEMRKYLVIYEEAVSHIDFATAPF
jgi:hypothetical protein